MQRVKEYVHQFEVDLLTPRQNNGIRVLQEGINLMNHRMDFELFMNPRKYLTQALDKLQDKVYLSSLFDRCFLNNEKMVIVRQLASTK